MKKRTNFKISSILVFAIVFLISGFSWGSEFPAKPSPARFMNDHIGFFSEAHQAYFEQRLQEFSAETSNQMVIVIVDDLLGMSPVQYATRIGHEWGVGQEKFDNGIVLLLKPVGKAGQKKVFIATGYGLEGAIPDAIAKRIVNKVMLPRFRKDEYFEGVDEACNILFAMAKGEYDYANKELSSDAGVAIIIVLILLALFFLIPVLQAARYARVNDIAFWKAFALLNQSSSKSKGKWRDFHGGGGSFGGGSFGGGSFGGGSFGGGSFGGGSFGGGGAGGSW